MSNGLSRTVLMMVLVGCGGETVPKSDLGDAAAVKPAAQAATAGVTVALGEFNLLDANNNPGPGMTKQGDIVYGTTVVARMSSSGEVRSPTNSLIASYDGSVLRILGTGGAAVSEVKIDPRGTILRSQTDSLYWTSAGTMIGNAMPAGFSFRIEPNDASLFMAASIVLVLHTTVTEMDVKVDSSEKKFRALKLR